LSVRLIKLTLPPLLSDHLSTSVWFDDKIVPASLESSQTFKPSVFLKLTWQVAGKPVLKFGE